MKIGIITSPFGFLPPDGIGAVEKLWFYIAQKFTIKGNDVKFYSKRSLHPTNGEMQIYGITGYERTGSLKLDLIKDFFYSIKALVKLKRCDVLVLNTFWSPVLCLLFRWKYKKCVYNVARFPKGQFWLYYFVDQFSCVSTAVVKALESEIGKDKRIVMVNNPVELSDFQYADEPENNKFIIMYHGRVHPEKGLDILFEAVNQLHQKYPNIQLKILGPTEIAKGGGGNKYVTKLNKICPNVKIEWIPAISNPKEIAFHLHSCNLYCYPSIADYGETFGVSPLEAMSVGRATIVSNLDCFKDFIINGETGFIFNHHSCDSNKQLAQIIEHLIIDPVLRKRVGLAACKKAKDFSVDKIADKYLCNFKTLLTIER